MEGEEFIRHFGRHCVTLSWFDKSPARAAENGGRGESQDVSGFVVSVKDQWYMITAGHVLEDIEKARHGGQVLSDFRINDCWGTKAVYPPQPFDYSGSNKWYQHDEEVGIDYGYIRLDENTRSRVAANGVVALSEGSWAKRTEFEDYIVVGTPAVLQSTEPLENAIKLKQRLALFHLKRISNPPEQLLKPHERHFFERPAILKSEEGDVVDDVDGMSGSPIFGGCPQTGRYYLLGIQSAGAGNIMIACLFLRLGMYLHTKAN